MLRKKLVLPATVILLCVLMFVWSRMQAQELQSELSQLVAQSRAQEAEARKAQIRAAQTVEQLALQNQNKKANQPKNKKKQGGKQAKNAAQAAKGRPDPPNSSFLTALHQAAAAGDANILSTGDSADDFVSIVETKSGELHAAYAAYFDGHDQIRIHRRLENGRWSTRSYVTLVQGRADIWMPQLAVDAADRVWVIWCEQTGQSPGKTGNWDLYARALVGDSWEKIIRLTDDPKPDINPHVVSDATGKIHIVWQAHPGNNGDVQYCRFDGTNWSKPLAVTADEESDWYPRVAIADNGTAWIAFDSYRNGDYDVFLTNVRDDQPGKVISIATSKFYEAHASVACTPDGRVWVAWEQGGHNWGKDQGYWLRQANREQGSTLGSTRSVKVACWHDDKIWQAPDVATSLEQGTRQRPSALAELTTGTDGRLWLRFRHQVRGQRRNARQFTTGWTENITTLASSGWTPATRLPASAGRISVFSRSFAAKDGSLYVGYSSDARALQNMHRPIQDTALVGHVDKPAEEVGIPELTVYTPPDPPATIPAWNASQENRQIATIRSHRVEIDGKPHQIVRGDLHRHTELSWDVGPGNDGSYLDFYRYMIDVAAMDFGGLTDHQGGGHYAYWWWLTEKSADMYYLAPRFVPLYGYERSLRFPNGHRNVFHAYRGVPVFPFQLKLQQTGPFPGVTTGEVVDNDTKLLYEYLRKSGGIAISHTSGTSSMGTDWRDNDPEVESVVEIYQGARNSYEALGAPRVHSQDEPPGKAPGGFQEAGLIWNAYQKGYRLGTIASSDHGSTHISYALVYTPANERAAILASILKRHTYGATDNVVVSFHANGHFMGDEFTTSEKPSLTLNVTGTAKISRLDLIRNNEYVFTDEPGKQTIDGHTFVDMTPKPGVNLYYYRILQENDEVAWSSPVWVNYQP